MAWAHDWDAFDALVLIRHRRDSDYNNRHKITNRVTRWAWHIKVKCYRKARRVYVILTINLYIQNLRLQNQPGFSKLARSRRSMGMKSSSHSTKLRRTKAIPIKAIIFFLGHNNWKTQATAIITFIIWLLLICLQSVIILFVNSMVYGSRLQISKVIEDVTILFAFTYYFVCSGYCVVEQKRKTAPFDLKCLWLFTQLNGGCLTSEDTYARTAQWLFVMLNMKI